MYFCLALVLIPAHLGAQDIDVEVGADGITKTATTSRDPFETYKKLQKTPDNVRVTFTNWFEKPVEFYWKKIEKDGKESSMKIGEIEKSGGTAMSKTFIGHKFYFTPKGPRP